MQKKSIDGLCFHAVPSFRAVSPDQPAFRAVAGSLRLPIQTLKIMRLLSVFLFVASLAVSARPAAQTITLSGKNLSLKQVFSAIKKQTGYVVFSEKSQLTNATPVSLSVNDVPLSDVLDKALTPNGLTYTIRGKTIFVTKAPVKAKPENVKDEDIEEEKTAIISGRVTNAKGEPLEGVSITVKGMRTGATTNAEGQFQLSVPSAKNVELVFSFVGYATQTIKVGSLSVFNVVMQEVVSDLSEVVAIGYGTIKKGSLTAAVSKVENKNLDQIPTLRPEDALIGRMAGISISQVDNSSPGNKPEIIIRGTGSISASNEPLIVVDGFPGGSFNNINMNDVASIEVLKDASAAAIYGSRGSGGIILITTKSGKSGKPKLNFNSHVGINNAIKYGKNAWVKGGQEYYDFITRYINRDFALTGGDVTLPPEDPNRPAAYKIYPIAKEGNHNWEDILFQPRFFQNYSLSVSGGSDNVNYFVSGNIKNDNGTLQETGYKQYTVRSKVDMNVTSKFKVGLMISPSYINRRLNPTSITELIKIPPFISPYKQEDGLRPNARILWGQGATAANNPLDILEGSHYYTTTYGTLGQIYGDLQLHKDLNLRSSVGVDINYSTDERFQELRAVGTGLRTGSATDTRTINWINENVLNYHHVFGEDHDVSAMLGQSTQYNLSRSAIMNAQNGSFTNDIIQTLNNAIVLPTSNTSKSQWGLSSFFFRANYSYKGKYLFSGSLRQDGSSRFGPENRWGYFPSASVAWRLSEEAFLNDSRLINELKLRASFGSVGNFNIGDFQYLGGIGSAPYSPDGKLVQGQAMVSFGNPKLAWEKTYSYDIGLELGLWNNRIYMTIDYYNKRTNNLLYNVSIPSITGFSNAITNVGDIKNEGVEIELTSRNIVNSSLRWTTSFNVTKNKNSVMRLGSDDERVINLHSRGMSWILEVGSPMFSYYGYKMEGVLKTKKDLQDYPIIPGQLEGSVRYKDLNGDGKIDQDDRMILGNYLPKISMGMVNDFSWRNWDMSITLQSSLGAKIYDYDVLNYTGILRESALKSVVENEWFSEAEPGDGKHPASSIIGLNFVGNNDYLIEDASFLALRNVNLGYTFPLKNVRLIHADKLRGYFSVSNALIITKKEFRGLNPEARSTVSGIGSIPGYHGSPNPLNRIFVLGVNISF